MFTNNVHFLLKPFNYALVKAIMTFHLKIVQLALQKKKKQCEKLSPIITLYT